MQDRPTAAELLEAVREFLERDVMSATEGRVKFHTRVAINALGMVGRELSFGPFVDAQARARAAELDLAARIRSGSLDDQLDEIRVQVRAAVRQKLLVANPGYLPEDERR